MDPSQRILITGADGFVGWHALQHFQNFGYTDIHVTTYSGSPRLVAAVGADNVHQIDLSQYEPVGALIQRIQPAAIIHFAALAFVGKSFEQVDRVMISNLRIQLAMLEAIKNFAPQARCISIGSAAGYGLLPQQYDSAAIGEDFPFFPDSPYALSKVTQEYASVTYSLAQKLDIVRVRPFNQIGPEQTADFAIPAFVQQIVQVERGQKENISVGNLQSVRDFTDVRDAAEAYRLLLENGEQGSVYNLGSGRGWQMSEVLEILLRHANRPIPVVQDPSLMRPSDVAVSIADNQRLRALGWRAVIKLEDSLRDILNYEREKNGVKA